MRIIGNIDHPTLKITVFKMDNKLSVKLESGFYEQTFKFRESAEISTLEDVKKIVDETFTQKVLEGISQMHRIKNETMSRNLHPPKENEFEEII